MPRWRIRCTGKFPVHLAQGTGLSLVLHARGRDVLGGHVQCEHPLSQTPPSTPPGSANEAGPPSVAHHRFVQKVPATPPHTARDEKASPKAQHLGPRRCTFKVNPPNFRTSFECAASCTKICWRWARQKLSGPANGGNEARRKSRSMLHGSELLAP